jgi:UDP-N-acetylglucosamine 3-dehydrogenase
MATRYKAAIIACGNIARHAHLPAYRKIEGVEVVAGADPSPVIRQAWERELGVPRMYADPAEMLDREKPDLVSVCCWPPLRPELTELAASSGVKAILAEKPFAVDMAGADRMIEACRRNNVLLVVGHQRRYHTRYVTAKALIDAGEIGDVVQVSGLSGVPTRGGDMLTGGTHTVDAVRFLAGDAPTEWVIGQIDVRDPHFTNAPIGLQEWEQTGKRYGHHVETGAFALIHFANGVRGTVENGIIGRRGGWPAIVYGTEGMIEIAADQPTEGEPLVRARLKGRTDWYVPDIQANDPFQVEIQEMITSLEGGGTHPLGAAAAREVHLIVMAIYESARRRARIDFPFEVGESPLEVMLREGEFDAVRARPVGA